MLVLRLVGEMPSFLPFPCGALRWGRAGVLGRKGDLVQRVRERLRQGSAVASCLLGEL